MRELENVAEREIHGKRHPWAVALAMLGMLLAAPSGAGAPDVQGAQQPGRFQPSQQIKADTIVDFPVDI